MYAILAIFEGLLHKRSRYQDRAVLSVEHKRKLCVLSNNVTFDNL